MSKNFFLKIIRSKQQKLNFKSVLDSKLEWYPKWFSNFSGLNFRNWLCQYASETLTSNINTGKHTCCDFSWCSFLLCAILMCFFSRSFRPKSRGQWTHLRRPSPAKIYFYSKVFKRRYKEKLNRFLFLCSLKLFHRFSPLFSCLSIKSFKNWFFEVF